MAFVADNAVEPVNAVELATYNWPPTAFTVSFSNTVVDKVPLTVTFWNSASPLLAEVNLHPWVLLAKLPVCTTEQAIEIIKKNIKNLNDWKEINDLIPKKFKEIKKLRKTGVAGFFAATLELTKEGLLSIMQKKSFDKLLIKERKWIKKKI